VCLANARCVDEGCRRWREVSVHLMKRGVHVMKGVGEVVEMKDEKPRSRRILPTRTLLGAVYARQNRKLGWLPSHLNA
jgi:hypothetical protein